jgi:hypothetical protein
MGFLASIVQDSRPRIGLLVAMHKPGEPAAELAPAVEGEGSVGMVSSGMAGTDPTVTGSPLRGSSGLPGPAPRAAIFNAAPSPPPAGLWAVASPEDLAVQLSTTAEETASGSTLAAPVAVSRVGPTASTPGHRLDDLSGRMDGAAAPPGSAPRVAGLLDLTPQPPLSFALPAVSEAQPAPSRTATTKRSSARGAPPSDTPPSVALPPVGSRTASLSQGPEAEGPAFGAPVAAPLSSAPPLEIKTATPHGTEAPGVAAPAPAPSPAAGRPLAISQFVAPASDLSRAPGLPREALPATAASPARTGSVPDVQAPVSPSAERALPVAPAVLRPDVLAALAAPRLPAAPAPRVAEPAEPRVQIDTVEVVVTSPPGARRAPRPAAPTPDLTSRLYLRRL